MRITKIEVKGFRVFNGNYELNLGKEGRNLLIYGENGSGKTSLYQSLNLFLWSRSPHPSFQANKNIFVTNDDNYVKISLGDGQNPDRLLEWSEISDPYSDPLVTEASKTKGFFDYKSLLETYFLQKGSETVNIFEILVENLLSNTRNGITKVPFGEEWTAIKRLGHGRITQGVLERLNLNLQDFTDGLTNVITDINTYANVILADFDSSISIEISLPSIVFDRETKHFSQTEIPLKVTYYNTPIVHHHNFLNESRLSAIALSIYLSSLLIIPPSQLKILVLDDVLIGLDMSNRLPLVKILQKEFGDWQIVLMTYDWVWYEMLCQLLPDPKWMRVELYCGKTDRFDIPIQKAGNNYLDKASDFLAQAEYRAAVIYIRTGFEHILKNYCAERRLKIKFLKDGKHESQDFWDVILREKLLDQSLIKDVEFHRSKILNPMSHAVFINPIRRDIQAALDTIRMLELNLSAIIQKQRSGMPPVINRKLRKPRKTNRNR